MALNDTLEYNQLGQFVDATRAEPPLGDDTFANLCIPNVEIVLQTYQLPN